MKSGYTFFLLIPLFFSSACGQSLSLPVWATATPTVEPVINFEITILTPTATARPMVTQKESTPVLSATTISSQPDSNTTTSPPTAQPTVTPTPLAPATPNAAHLLITTITPTITLTIEKPVADSPSVTSTVLPITNAASLTPSLSSSDTLILLEPIANFRLPPGINELEFKWQWAGGKSCRSAEGYGFEVRIWPAVTGYGPMGVTDAVKNQQDFYCDPISQVASYRVVNLKGTPGVAAMGSGKFLWDVAYITLNPYTVVTSSAPRLLEIP